jgi:hypothetical protein
MAANSCINYKKHLENVFHYLSYNPDIANGCPKVSEYASQACKRLQLQKDPCNWELKIGPWHIPISDEDDNFYGQNAFLSLYGLVKAENSKLVALSFSAGIFLPTRSIIGKNCKCSRKNQKTAARLVRLFRFERGIGNAKTAETGVHFHYGGLPDENLASCEFFHCLEYWIKKPRIPFPPLDFALFLELFFKQFNVGLKEKFFVEPFWVNYVQTSEVFLLKGYYDKIGVYFSQNKGPKTLLDNLCSTDDLLP